MRATALQEVLISTEGDRPVVLQAAPPVTVRGRVVLEEPPEEIQEPQESSRFPRFNYARIEPRSGYREEVFVSCRSDTATFFGSGKQRFFEVLASPGQCRLATNGPPGSYVAGMSDRWATAGASADPDRAGRACGRSDSARAV